MDFIACLRLIETKTGIYVTSTFNPAVSKGNERGFLVYRHDDVGGLGLRFAANDFMVGRDCGNRAAADAALTGLQQRTARLCARAASCQWRCDCAQRKCCKSPDGDAKRTDVRKSGHQRAESRSTPPLRCLTASRRMKAADARSSASMAKCSGLLSPRGCDVSDA